MDKKIIIITSALIAILAAIASGAGLLWEDLYKNDTVSGAAQMTGNDLVTFVFCVPLLLVSAYYAARGSLRGRLIWTGTIFFFLYTYASMSFLATYNQMFLAYVAIFSLSLYTFAASILTLDVNKVRESLTGAPVKVTAGFMFFIGIAILLMWLGVIIPSLVSGEAPALLETYTTLVIQALDLGVVVPLAFITGVLLLKNDAWGYALASIVLIKGITLGTGILSMVLFMILNGVEVVAAQALLFIVLVACSLILAVAFYGKMKDKTMVPA
ncbi:hypothetical protein CUJ83_11050 [Methanocella sp. CWC-04]|uniref:Uncharacterized protein n=1 Tax=Methanooceanicella nereidis TaxID=2052831 RepID=A0AAP2REV6_9EURY|nr:hypothetical protein [Methanocella sp. CWC-04]MCD1295536.1 hypothetical protein [Methanocella sp. CWC-04]